MGDLNPFGITKEMIIKILTGVSSRMQIFKKMKDEYDIVLSNKNLSEILGKIMEKVSADVFTKHMGYEVKRALADRDPDLVFTKINKPLEIKITSTDNAWTGGEFSQRPFDYLLVSWGGKNYDEFFCCLVHLEKEDWKSNISKRFYGPSLGAKTVNKKEKIVFFGDFEVTMRGAVKIKRMKMGDANGSSRL